ncbi:MAG: hypothetical protein WCR55_14055, partial [Lentisphaerota bacterium]
MKVFKHLFLTLIVLSLSACGNPTVEKVKNSTLPFNKDMKIGDALDKYKYFKSKSWEKLDNDTDDKVLVTEINDRYFIRSDKVDSKL